MIQRLRKKLLQGVIHDSKTKQKNNFSSPDSSNSPKRVNNISTDPAFLTSKFMPPTKISPLKVESFSLHFQIIFSTVRKLHMKLARCENKILWDKTVYIPQNFPLNDLRSFYRNVLFRKTLYISILTAFEPQMLNPIHICQKSFTTHWMTKRWKVKTIIASQHYSSNELLFLTTQSAGSFRKSNFDTMQIKILNLFPELKIPLQQKFMKMK